MKRTVACLPEAKRKKKKQQKKTPLPFSHKSSINIFRATFSLSFFVVKIECEDNTIWLRGRPKKERRCF